MKLKVIGWTEYDNYDYKAGVNGWAAINAIIDDIKKHKYKFTGYDHEERRNCAPILNDGKIYRFSQRGFGGLMAEAHGDTGRMDYTMYSFSFSMDEKFARYPYNAYYADEVKIQENLNEVFDIEVSQENFNSAQESGEITLDDLPELRYLDINDEVILKRGENSQRYIVIDVDRKKDLTDKERLNLEMDFCDFQDEQRRKRANEIFNNTKVIMIVKLKNHKE